MQPVRKVRGACRAGHTGVSGCIRLNAAGEGGKGMRGSRERGPPARGWTCSQGLEPVDRSREKAAGSGYQSEGKKAPGPEQGSSMVPGARSELERAHKKKVRPGSRGSGRERELEGRLVASAGK